MIINQSTNKVKLFSFKKQQIFGSDQRRPRRSGVETSAIQCSTSPQIYQRQKHERQIGPGKELAQYWPSRLHRQTGERRDELFASRRHGPARAKTRGPHSNAVQRQKDAKR
jgi:hypothetical protein